MIILIGILFGIALWIPAILKARRERRFAWAKLRMIEELIRLEDVMLSGRISVGQAVHDHWYKNLSSLALCKRYAFTWNVWSFWKTLPAKVEIRKDVKADRLLTEIDDRFSTYCLRAVRNSRPWASALFMLWFWLSTGALLTVLTASVVSLTAAIGIRTQGERLGEAISDMQARAGAVYREVLIRSGVRIC